MKWPKIFNVRRSWNYFRSSTKFQTGTENGKPVIYWEQQALAKDKKKKVRSIDLCWKHKRFDIDDTSCRSLRDVGVLSKAADTVMTMQRKGE